MALILSLIVISPGHTMLPPKSQPEPITYEVTAYTAHCPGCSGITASGIKPVENVTIACPPYLDFGTWLRIENVGLRRCDDRGGAIKGKRLDLFIPSLGQALEFGRQQLEVWIE